VKWILKRDIRTSRNLPTQDLSSPNWNLAWIPEENSSRNFSGGAGNGAARRIARITESSKAESF
jgi:hypothetical protein